MKKILALSIMMGVSVIATTSYAGGYWSELNCGNFRLVRHVDDYNYETPTFDELVDNNGNQIAYSDKTSSDFTVMVQGGHVIVKVRGQYYTCGNAIGGPNNSGN